MLWYRIRYYCVHVVCDVPRVCVFLHLASRLQEGVVYTMNTAIFWLAIKGAIDYDVYKCGLKNSLTNMIGGDCK